MGQHQSADGGVWHHHPVFCEVDTYLSHVQKLVEDKVHRLVGKGRVAHGRTDALKLLVVQLADAQFFVGAYPQNSLRTCSCNLSAVASASRSAKVCTNIRR